MLIPSGSERKRGSNSCRLNEQSGFLLAQAVRLFNFSLMSRIAFTFACVPLLLCSSCTLVEDMEKRKIARAEQLRLLKIEEESAVAHAAFRTESGWQKKTYRNETVLAMVTEENAGIQISLKDQRGLLMVGEWVALDFPVASGKRSHPTPVGHYTILDKKTQHRSNLYGRIYDAEGGVADGDADSRRSSVPEGGRFVGASMPYWMRLTNTGVGLHVGYVPGGRPASHGCVRLPKQVAPEIFSKVRLGTPVIIADQAPTVWSPPNSPSAPSSAD